VETDDSGADLYWTSVATGTSFNTSCGLVSDGTMRCWGGPSCVARAPPATEQFVQVSAGVDDVCALRPDGTLACWCCDPANQGTCEEMPSGQFTRGVTVAGDVLCWGDDPDMPWLEVPRLNP